MSVLEEKHQNNFTGDAWICQKLRNWYENDCSFGNIALFQPTKISKSLQKTLNISFGCTY